MNCSISLIFVSFMGLLIPQEALAQLLEPQCGITGVVDKIKNGNDAVHGAFPWMAYLYRNKNEFVCGGSLIHKRFVLTAAHCIVKQDNLSVRLGEYSTEYRANSSTVYRVTMGLRNRLHRKTDHVNDIGMLRLDREVQYNATGWGETSNSRIAAVLQMLELQDVDPKKCYKHMGVHLGPGQICASHPTGDTCLGDSGGPLVHRVDVDGTYRYVQLGIVSYGLSECIGPGV